MAQAAQPGVISTLFGTALVVVGLVTVVAPPARRARRARRALRRRGPAESGHGVTVLEDPATG